MITVEVAYAKEQEQALISLKVPPETTVETVIQLSGLLQRYPEIDLQKNKIGIFSKFVLLTEKLNQGDRVEIYRPLRIDPNQARLLRAARAKKLKKE